MSDTQLTDHIAGWEPSPTTEFDALDPAQANRLAATLDLDAHDRSDGAVLPLPWHWVYFPAWPATSHLGPDGHPEHGHFLPPIPHRRRMFAGSKMRVHNPLLLGVPTEKRSEVAGMEIKHGRTGEMLFVTVRSTYTQRDATALVEDQVLVYRSDQSTARPFDRAGTELAPSNATWSSEPAPNPMSLFRFSALTSNAHRIHYDRPYAAQIEGYPDLVVHGPLLAVYMAALAEDATQKALCNFEFRLQRPVFLGDRFRVEADPADGDAVTMRVISGRDTTHATATGVFR
ncbi:MaoC/PaaZ C-terminal domain-containing protein [Mycobacterium sp. OTB74]|uniref:MaoC/PaaZ C-terminal domain-containing protein n=1 Tax=Mycobacterium sp. OTB74 TaxID=1853452 RepID=UPI0024730C8A|nr:MaoC/PaaZ C-terminal domain-containing protein [Mycobacterium sp. OTB74]MDH6244480.1 3-methylfumaryl-CoA hydratase [Mycobacterium sp. OTB74]